MERPDRFLNAKGRALVENAVPVGTIRVTTPPTATIPTSIVKEALHKRAIEFRLNTRGRFVEIRRREKTGPGEYNGPWSWERADDGVIGWLRIELSEKCSYYKKGKGGKTSEELLIPRAHLDDLVTHLCTNHRHDPLETYFDDLPEWDRKPRIDGALSEVFWAEDTELNRWASRSLWIGVVQRTLKPGCQLDEVIVLRGPSGCGKTRWLGQMFPEEGLHRETVLNQGQKELVEAMSGAAIIEFGELSGLKKADLQRTKMFLTIKLDAIRMAYGRSAVEMPRRCIFVGTTDQDKFLPEDGEGGNRRFVVAGLVRKPLDGEDVQGGLVESWMEENREQCWAEALHQYKGEGVTANLPRTLIEDARRTNRGHVWEGDPTVADFLHSRVLRDVARGAPNFSAKYADAQGLPRERPRIGIPFLRIKEAYGIYDSSRRFSDGLQRELLQALKTAGWKGPKRRSKPLTGQSKRVWVPPKGWEWWDTRSDESLM